MSVIGSSDVDMWTKAKCVDFLRTVKGAKLSGSKSELLSRVKGYTEHPEILESIQKAPQLTLTTALDIESIDETSLHWNSDTNYLPSVTIDTVECYVKTRKQAAQALQEKGYRIFASRRIVSVATANVDQERLLVKAFVRPTMEGKPARALWISFQHSKPTQAFCKCPAGKSGLCCHVSATLYALEEHTRSHNLTLELPCTSKLQTWHKNKPWKGNVTTIENIRVQSATKKSKKPQQRESRTISKKVQKSFNDSTNCSNAEREQRLLYFMSSSSSTRKSSICKVLSHRYQEEQSTCDDCPLTVLTTGEENMKMKIEESTRGQRNNPLWHQYRQYRITSSTARKLLHSTDVGRPALINKIMNLQPVHNEENIPPAMLYGIMNEDRARQRYANITGHAVQECGCFVEGVLLASPDGYVPDTDHLLEIKGLANQRDQKVLDAINDKQSCKSYPYALTEDGKPFLKKDNCRGYYEQVQLQMGLSGKTTVDFIVYTNTDMVYFPIQFDEVFFSGLKLELQQWHKAYIKPLLTSEKSLKF